MKTLLGVSAALLATVGGVVAAPVPVPTTLRLQHGVRLAEITVKNDGDIADTFDISVNRWRQNLYGDLILTPTSDIEVSPTRLTLGPQQAARVSLRIDPGGNQDERAYRLVFGHESSDADRSRSLLVRSVDMPVFIGGEPETPYVEVKARPAGNGAISVEVFNRGSTTVRPTDVRITGKARDGASLFSFAHPGWYILPHTSISYPLQLSTADCRHLASLSTTVKIGDQAKASSLRWSNLKCDKAPSGAATGFFRPDEPSVFLPGKVSR